MNNLFYSDEEGILFWVTGYTVISGQVSKIIEMLSEKSQQLAEIAGVDVTAINTFEVTKSRRYNQMCVFYVETKTVPENAFRISSEEHRWTMNNWIEY